MKRIFIYGSVCIWFAEDNPMSYQKFENSRASRRTINLELRNLEALEKNKDIKTNFRHLVLVHYKGYSVVVQTIIPNLPLETYAKDQI
jgi:hypothetical protein